MIKYKINVEVSNGYSCSCCSDVWNNSQIIDCELDEVSAQKKSNHNIAILEQDVFLLGCKTIESLCRSEELTYNHSISYSFFNKDIEDDVEIVWPNPFDLENRWKRFVEEWKTKKEQKYRASEIRKLEERLKSLKDEM